MRIRVLFRSRWVRLPLIAIAVTVLAAGSWLGLRLGTTRLSMYDATGVVDAAPCPADEATETIVYTSLRPGNLDIYLFDDLASAPRRLAAHANLDYKPVLSRDGRWVVFASDRDGATNLYALDLGVPDAEPVALTTHPGMDDAPTLSPDGAQVAWVSTRGGRPDIWKMPFVPGDPTAEARAVNLTDTRFGDFNPAWSPDGTRIAFASNRGLFRRWNPLRLMRDARTVTDIYVMNVDGSGNRRVVRRLGIAGSPAWTEDGDALLYYLQTGPAASAVYRTPLRGRGARRLSPDGMAAFTPTAGPDGSVIFVGATPGDAARGPAAAQPAGRLYRVEADGTGLVPLVDDGGRYLAPRFDPASGRLVAHGDGPVGESGRMANGTPFTWPADARAVRIGERCVRLHAVRSYFPSVDERTGRVVAAKWVHERNGSPEGPSPIVSAALDGTSLRTVLAATDAGFMWAPVVTRDGEWVFFSTGARFGAPGDNVGIWKIRADGTGAVHLTAGSAANDAMPDVSADGRWVAFRSGRDAKPGSGRNGAKEIYLMDSDGGQQRRITYTGAVNTMPAIAPDGSQVVFTTTRTGVGWKLWTQSLTDPEDPGRPLEPDRARLEGRDMHPRFSPDGRWIVFTSDRAGFMDEIGLSGMFPQPYGELFAIPADGSGPAVRLTHDKWEDGLAHWAGIALPAPGAGRHGD